MANQGNTNIWQKGWIKAKNLGLEGEDAIMWNAYVDRPHKIQVILIEE